MVFNVVIDDFHIVKWFWLWEVHLVVISPLLFVVVVLVCFIVVCWNTMSSFDSTQTPQSINKTPVHQDYI